MPLCLFFNSPVSDLIRHHVRLALRVPILYMCCTYERQISNALIFPHCQGAFSLSPPQKSTFSVPSPCCLDSASRLLCLRYEWLRHCTLFPSEHKKEIADPEARWIAVPVCCFCVLNATSDCSLNGTPLLFYFKYIFKHIFLLFIVPDCFIFLWFLTFKNEVIVSLAQMAVGYDKTAGSSYCEAKNGLLFR